MRYVQNCPMLFAFCVLSLSGARAEFADLCKPSQQQIELRMHDAMFGGQRLKLAESTKRAFKVPSGAPGAKSGNPLVKTAVLGCSHHSLVPHAVKLPLVLPADRHVSHVKHDCPGSEPGRVSDGLTREPDGFNPLVLIDRREVEVVGPHSAW